MDEWQKIDIETNAWEKAACKNTHTLTHTFSPQIY